MIVVCVPLNGKGYGPPTEPAAPIGWFLIPHQGWARVTEWMAFANIADARMRNGLFQNRAPGGSAARNESGAVKQGIAAMNIQGQLRNINKRTSATYSAML